MVRRGILSFDNYMHLVVQGLSDFTSLKGIEITISGQSFKHLLYHFRLAYSNWSFIKVIQGGESFIALSKSLQDALWKLGGCPAEASN
jgi:hypothetical protein